MRQGVETSAEVGGRGQADPLRDRLDGEVGLLQQGPGRRGALLKQPAAGADAELVGEPAGECARRGPGLRGQGVEDFIGSAVRAFPDRHPALVSHEVLLAPPGTLLYVSRCRSEEDLVAYAGEHWRDQPVVCRARTNTSWHRYRCGTSPLPQPPDERIPPQKGRVGMTVAPIDRPLHLLPPPRPERPGTSRTTGVRRRTGRLAGDDLPCGDRRRCPRRPLGGPLGRGRSRGLSRRRDTPLLPPGTAGEEDEVEPAAGTAEAVAWRSGPKHRHCGVSPHSLTE